MPLTVAPLFQPLAVGSLTVANRFVMAPMTRCFSPDGIPSQDVVAYYRRRAEAEVGLIITEGVGVDHPAALGFAGLDELDVPDMHGAAALKVWKEIVDEVHSVGGKIIPQLWHQGVMRQTGTGRQPHAPSSRPSGLWGPPARNTSMTAEYVEKMTPVGAPMSESEIAEVIAAFVRCAVNAINVGFDGIALHGAHGYLLDTFLWAETNKRNDRYGRDLLGRTRFVTDIIAGIRREIGPKFPIMYRYSQWKQQDFDAQLARDPFELEMLLKPLCDAGVDIFDASTRDFAKPAFEGSDLSLAGWTRKVTGRTTMAVGGIGLKKDMYTSYVEGSDADTLDRVLKSFDRGDFDLAGVGRSLMIDPEFVLKAKRGAPFLPFKAEVMKSRTLY
jgi:2,4-dienoyl-CoA reductase-like NADH-dependent reductase (Old Yellow Enzyme family)